MKSFGITDNNENFLNKTLYDEECCKDRSARICRQRQRVTHFRCDPQKGLLVRRGHTNKGPRGALADGGQMDRCGQTDPNPSLRWSLLIGQAAFTASNGGVYCLSLIPQATPPALPASSEELRESYWVALLREGGESQQGLSCCTNSRSLN